MLLKFITGSSRLTLDERVHVSVGGSDDNKFPIGHTCGYSVDCPAYSTLEIMMKKFRIAM